MTNPCRHSEFSEAGLMPHTYLEQQAKNAVAASEARTSIFELRSNARAAALGLARWPMLKQSVPRWQSQRGTCRYCLQPGKPLDDGIDDVFLASVEDRQSTQPKPLKTKVQPAVAALLFRLIGTSNQLPA